MIHDSWFWFEINQSSQRSNSGLLVRQSWIYIDPVSIWPRIDWSLDRTGRITDRRSAHPWLRAILYVPVLILLFDIFQLRHLSKDWILKIFYPVLKRTVRCAAAKSDRCRKWSKSKTLTESGCCEAWKKSSANFQRYRPFLNSNRPIPIFCFSVTYFVSCTETRFSAWFSASDIFKLFVKVTDDSETVWPTCSSPKWSEFKCLTKPRHIFLFSFLLSKISNRSHWSVSHLGNFKSTKSTLAPIIGKLLHWESI